MKYTRTTELPLDVIRSAPRLERPRGNRGSTVERRVVLDLVTAFDVETSWMDVGGRAQAWVYSWAWTVGPYTVQGRTIQQWQAMMARVAEALGSDETLVVYAHNLSHEWQFLSGVYHFDNSEIFAMEPRKILKATQYGGKIEYRCSYIHSNLALRDFLRSMAVETQKLELDYSRRRYPWTPLSAEEWEYQCHDTEGLVEAIRREMELDGDNLNTIPLTSTGYVRRMAKKAMRELSHTYIPRQTDDYDVYLVLREAFRGGDTHGSRWYTNVIVEDVDSWDRSSSYPDVLVNDDYPVTKFQPLGRCTAEQVADLIWRRHRAVLMRVRLWGVKLRPASWPMPYLAQSKCRELRGAHYDNGRVLRADYLETTLTESDYQILLKEYDWSSIDFWQVWHARKGRLPRQLRELIIQLYRGKTSKKGIPSESVYYDRDKRRLNATFGMMATLPVRPKIVYDPDRKDPWPPPVTPTGEAGRALYDEAMRKAFLRYAWGVWCTSLARLRLHEIYWACGDTLEQAGDRVCYGDTDSCKCVDVDPHRFDAYNAARIKASTESGAWADDRKGVRHYMGVVEYDGHYRKAVFLSAKKYAYFADDGRLHITIAGVGKAAGADELAMAGGLGRMIQDDDRRGFVFSAGGGLEAVYNDDPRLPSLEIDGHQLIITSNVALTPSTYTLGWTDDYRDLIKYGDRVLDDLDNL